MRFLGEDEIPMMSKHLELAVDLARYSDAKSPSGALLFRMDTVIGFGHNGMPEPGETNHCYCRDGDLGYHDACRTHAEQRAMRMAVEDAYMSVEGSELVFVRLKPDGDIRQDHPFYCSACSGMALRLGVMNIIFQTDEGIALYPAKEYDDYSQMLG